ncbi:MAG: AraC family transcriptional regulator [Planctomycetota bacterium]|jgi:AraC-like DNA-binding protein
MLSSILALPFFTDAIFFPRSGPGLHALLTSAGHSRETEARYDFDGLQRGNQGFMLFQYTLAGEGALEFEGRPYRLRAGDAMILTIPHAHRYWLPSDSKSWEFVYLCLTGREVLRLAGELMALRGPVWQLNERTRPVQEAVEICGLVSRNEIVSQYQASSLAYGFLMTLAAEALPGGEERAMPEWANAVIRFCRESYGERIGVDEMAAVSGYSRYHFSRLFHRLMGNSPGEYLQGVRLNEAARMLTRSSLRVKEIAFESGFRDYNYFCRAFRKHYGQSPGAFRKSGLT